jgi:hypothetical protein
MEHKDVLSEDDKDFLRIFLEITNMVKEFWEDLEKRRGTPHQNEGGLVETMVKNEATEEGGEGEKPPGSPPSPSSSSSSSSSSSYSFEESEHSSHKRKKCSKMSSHSHDLPLLKLDAKFYFPTYDEELNIEKLDNWVKQSEVYCRVNKIIQDTSRIQLATLRLSNTSLIRWESRIEDDLIQHGKMVSSWIEFFFTCTKMMRFTTSDTGACYIHDPPPPPEIHERT